MLALLLLALQSADTPTIANNRVPSASVVAEIEARLKLPSGAGPLGGYTRFYTEADISGRDSVIGQMIDSRTVAIQYELQHKPAPPPVVRGLEADMQIAFDGGCSVVNVMYDVAAKTPPIVMCNPPGPGGR